MNISLDNNISVWILGLEGLISTNTAVHTNKQALF